MMDKPYILYVDDETENRVVFEATFEARFNVHVEDGSEGALRFLETHEVAVVVSDQRMAGMKGDELLAKVRERWPRIIRIILTGYKEVDAILRAVNNGLVARYIVKPWAEEELGEILEWGLQAYALAFESYGNILQDRLLESEKLAALGGHQAAFLHELGTPLSYILGSVSELSVISAHTDQLLELIERDTSRPREEWSILQSFLRDFPEILEDLRTGTNLLTHLRDDVHTLVSPPHEGKEHSCSGSAVLRAIEFAMSVNKRDAILANTSLHFERPQGAPSLLIAPENLMLVLINLTRNAIQSHDPNLSDNQVLFTLESDESRAMARLSISDNGTGMSQEVAGMLGKQFFTTRSAGTGLGVFRCKALLGRIGGSLDYSRKTGRGTIATATIPIRT